MFDDSDDLTLVLGTRFEGIQEARSYASSMEKVARAEADTARSVEKAAAAQSALNSTRGRNNYGSIRNGGGPNARLAAINDSILKASQSGASGDVMEDLLWRRRKAQSARDSMWQKKDPMYDALSSMRVGNGQFAPLLGKSMEATLGPQLTKSILGTVSKVAGGPIGIAIGGAVVLGKAFYELAEASAKNTNALMTQATLVGGSVGQAARIQAYGGAIGASGQAARSFQERITSDPNSMGAAAAVGISNAKAPYGRMDFGKQYLSAIQRVAAVRDENMRQRLAFTLGIEEEVARYSKLSSYSRQALERTARLTELINDPQQARYAAEHQANTTRLSEAWKNLTTVGGKSVAEPVTAIQEGMATFLESLTFLADVLVKLNHFSPINIASRLYKSGMGFAKEHALWDPLKQQGQGGNSAMVANTQATADLTTAIQRLTGTIGGGQKVRESLDGLQKGPFLHEMLNKKALRSGAMG